LYEGRLNVSTNHSSPYPITPRHCSLRAISMLLFMNGLRGMCVSHLSCSSDLGASCVGVVCFVCVVLWRVVLCRCSLILHSAPLPPSPHLSLSPTLFTLLRPHFSLCWPYDIVRVVVLLLARVQHVDVSAFVSSLTSPGASASGWSLNAIIVLHLLCGPLARVGRLDGLCGGLSGGLGGGLSCCGLASPLSWWWWW